MLVELQQYAQQFNDQPWVTTKIMAAVNTIKQLENHALPDKPLPNLSFTQKQILNYPSLMPLDDLFANLRQEIITTFGIWHVPNQQWLQDLHTFISGRRVLEIMAGNGVITSQLRKLGDQVVATDSFDWQGQDIQTPQPWTDVKSMSATMAIQSLPFEVLIMSWAPDTDESDVSVLSELRQRNFQGDFIVIGEPYLATNSQKFWQMADLTLKPELNQHHTSFDVIKDHVFLVK